MYVRSQAHTPVKHLWKIKHTPARDKVNHAVLLQTIRQFLAQSVPAYSPCKDAIQIAGRAKPHWKALSKQMKGVCQVHWQQAKTLLFYLAAQYPFSIICTNCESDGEALKWGNGSDGLYMSYLVHLNFIYLLILISDNLYTKSFHSPSSMVGSLCWQPDLQVEFWNFSGLNRSQSTNE